MSNHKVNPTIFFLDIMYLYISILNTNSKKQDKFLDPYEFCFCFE